MIKIREEQPQDIKAIRKINMRAFGQTQEATLVENLRQNCNDLLSLVALMENHVVGHILFSPAIVEVEDRTVHGMGLAPMAVLPEYQRRGIGSELIRSGIATLASRQCPFVIVLGHAHYYPRFGFEPAGRRGIRSQWEVPADTFMILVLDEAEMRGITGVAKYLPEFADAM
jgi:putative acetyltransferase